MSDLFTSLNSAARALDAQRMGLDVVGQNIANVNSPGYTRRTLTFDPIAPTNKYSAGGGVTVTDIHAQRDLLIERRLRLELSAEQKEAALAQTLGVIDLALGTSGASIDADLSAFFDAFSTLAETPTSAVTRNEVQAQAAALAAALRNMSAGLDAARRDADRQIGATVDEINNLVSRISALNGTIASAGAAAELKLTPQDEQERLVRELSKLADVTALRRDDGGVDISIGNGRPLVVGFTSYPVEKVTTGPAGYLDLTTGGFSIVDEIDGGHLSGLLQVRDSAIPAYSAQLDELAYALAQEVNALHASGFDLSGNAGADFFSFSMSLSGSAGAAAAIRLDPAIAGDPSLIAAAGTTEPGSNTVARAIAALRDAKVLGSGTATLHDAWGQLVYRVGRDVKDAESALATRSDIVNQVEMLRDQVSGISLDEEAALMLRFQRAYEANARFFRVVDETLDMLMALA